MNQRWNRQLVTLSGRCGTQMTKESSVEAASIDDIALVSLADKKNAAPEQENVSPLNELSTKAFLFTVKCLDICEDLLPKEVFLPTHRLLFTFSVSQKKSLGISFSSKCISSCRAKSLSWPRSPFRSLVTQGSNSSVFQNCWLVFWLNTFLMTQRFLLSL